MGPLGALMLALAFGSAVAQAAEEGSVPSADRNLFFLRQPAAPDGVTLLPLDAVERWLNTKATVTGDEITLSDYGGESHTALGLRLTIGSKTGFVNRKEIELPAAPRLIEGAVYVPLRVIADAVGVWVEPVDHRVHLRKPDLNWECWLAGPRDPRSLEGKMVALALGPKLTTPARIEDVGLSADTLLSPLAGRLLYSDAAARAPTIRWGRYSSPYPSAAAGG